MAQNCVICGSQITDEVFDRNAGICDACWGAQYERANPLCPQIGLEALSEKNVLDLMHERMASENHAEDEFSPQNFKNKPLDAYEFPAFLSAQVVDAGGWDRDLLIHTVHTIDPYMKKFYIFALCAFGFICFTILVTIFTSFDLLWMIFDNYVTVTMFVLLSVFVISLFAYAIADFKRVIIKNWFYIGKDYIGCYRGIGYNQTLSRKFEFDEIEISFSYNNYNKYNVHNDNDVEFINKYNVHDDVEFIVSRKEHVLSRKFKCIIPDNQARFLNEFLKWYIQTKKEA